MIFQIFIKFLILFLIYLLNLSHLDEQQSKQLVVAVKSLVGTMEALKKYWKNYILMVLWSLIILTIWLEKVINLSNMTNNMPKENIFTSERMTNQTISLYQDLLAKRL